MQLNEIIYTIEQILGKEAAKLFTILIKQKPVPADCIVLLQGDRLDRVELVERLYKKKFAPRILITGNNVLIGKGKRFEENDIHLSILKNYLVKRGIPEKDISIEDQSFNTKEQAEHTIEVAARNHWSKLLIVTSLYHILRAYLTLIRESMKQHWTGGIIMQAIHSPWDNVPSGREKTAKEMFLMEIRKIKKYKNDIADIKEGFEYIKKQLKIRPLKPSDSKGLWAIRNSESARRWSLKHDPIKFSEHAKWFRAYSANPENICFTLIHGEELIGYVRFDCKSNSYITSIAIAENYQGLGLGDFLLRYPLERMKPHGKEIIATIRLDNVASLKLFQKYHFVKYRQEGTNAYFMYKP